LAVVAERFPELQPRLDQLAAELKTLAAGL
jgi:hypothetical protein